MKALMFLMAVAAAQAFGGTERALIAYMTVRPGTEQAFVKAAQTVIEESRREAGSIRYQLHQSTTNPHEFVFYELFDTDADLQFHKSSQHVKAFLKTTEPITVKFTLEEYAPIGDLQLSH